MEDEINENSMSRWTHIAATFRIDHIRFVSDGILTEEIADKIFGRVALFPKEEEQETAFYDYLLNPKGFLPGGTEGTLNRSIWVNPDATYTAAYTVSVFGDLRDYNDVESIKEWFCETCHKIGESNYLNGMFLRSAVCLCEEEGTRNVVFASTGASYNGELDLQMAELEVTR